MEHFQDLQERDTPQCYFQEPTKSILFLAPRNLARADEFFPGMGIKIVNDSRYLWGFVRNRASADS